MKMEEVNVGGLGVGVTVDIQRTDGRVHSATVSAVNPAARSVTVEWFEKGETKGKEIDFDAVFALNPDLAPQDQNVMPPPKLDDEDEESSLSEADLSDYVSGLNVGRMVRGSGRLLRSSRTHSNVPAAAHHPQRPPSAHTSHLPRPPGHQVARSQSASRLSMVRQTPSPSPARSLCSPSLALPSYPRPGHNPQKPQGPWEVVCRWEVMPPTPTAVILPCMPLPSHLHVLQ